jgi:hypothetical protein
MWFIRIRCKSREKNRTAAASAWLRLRGMYRNGLFALNALQNAARRYCSAGVGAGGAEKTGAGLPAGAAAGAFCAS